MRQTAMKWRRSAAAGAAALAASAGASAEAIRPDATMLQNPDVSETQIVFEYANDLWVVSRAGGAARKLASPPGRESNPKFSADGSTIAFMGNYDGDLDLYTIPADGAGAAFRVTHHPANEVLTDWTADGRLIYFASGFAGLPRMTSILTVDAEGGLPELAPVPYGAQGAVSPDGEWLAYTPHTRDGRTWKRYRGGMATDIWLFNLNTYESRRVTDWEGTDTIPMWHGSKLYYLSDGGPNHRLNIWSFDVQRGTREQVTDFEDFDVKWPSIGPGVNGRGEIVFQNGPSMYLLDLRSGNTRAVEVTIPGDRPTLRDQMVEYGDYLTDGTISPAGERAVLEARGELWSLPAEKGIVRNLTNTSGVAERDPRWSPDGRWIAYLSDESGEYDVYVTQSDGKGETRRLTDDAAAHRYLIGWSPDSEHLVFTEKSGEVVLLNFESGEQKVIAKDEWVNQWQAFDVSWSHDSNWIAFHLADPDNIANVVHLYDVENGELTAVTSNMFSSSSPVFDRKGEFLYFSSTRNFSPTYSDIDTTFVYNDASVLIAVPLNEDVENPWALESDEVTWEVDEEEADEDGDGADDADGEGAGGDEGDADADADEGAEDGEDPFEGFDTESPIWGVWTGEARGLEQMNAMAPGQFPDDAAPYRLTIIVKEDGELIVESEFMGETSNPDFATFDPDTGAYTAETSNGPAVSRSTATLEGDTLRGQWTIEIAVMDMSFSGTWEVTRTDEEITEEMLGELAESDSGSDEPVVIDLEGFESRAMMLNVEPGSFNSLAVNDKNVLMYIRSGDGLPAIKAYDITKDEDGEKNVLAPAFGFGLSADGKKMIAGGPAGWGIVSAAPGQSLSDTLPMDRMTGYVDPREEWRQIFHEAWRIQRDFFYDPGLHGVDWEYVRDRYEAMLDDAVTREDVSFIIREMISELNVGHAYYFGGDTEPSPSVNVGMLGVDYEWATVDGESAYRIARIYEGGAWDVDARNPLRAKGVDVEEGHFLLAVNGTPLSGERDPHSAFIGLAGEVTELTVSEKPFMDDDARTVLVEPMWSEMGLRYRHWIEQNRAYVEYKSGGRLGYIYVPNTGVQGQNELFRQFYGQAHKEGLIIDERWNGGGQIPTRFIELLNRPRTNYWARRDGNDWPWPPDSHQGPKCMLINGLAGSGGDMFPALFRQNGLGKLIGTRTWGGLVGISGNPPLLDGAGVTAPTFGYYENDGTWGIEGHGVDPDIEIIDDPALMVSLEGEVADPQLDAAIQHMMAEIERNPYVPPTRPAGPDRSGMGVTEEDK